MYTTNTTARAHEPHVCLRVCVYDRYGLTTRATNRSHQIARHGRPATPVFGRCSFGRTPQPSGGEVTAGSGKRWQNISCTHRTARLPPVPCPPSAFGLRCSIDTNAQTHSRDYTRCVGASIVTTEQILSTKNGHTRQVYFCEKHTHTHTCARAPSPTHSDASATSGGPARSRVLVSVRARARTRVVMVVCDQNTK